MSLLTDPAYFRKYVAEPKKIQAYGESFKNLMENTYIENICGLQNFCIKTNLSFDFICVCVCELFEAIFYSTVPHCFLLSTG